MTCILCGGGGTPLKQRPAIHICNDCGFLHVPERRSAREIADDWADIYKRKAYDPNWPGVQARLFYVSEFLNPQDRTVLDIGAGNGSFLGFCKDAGAECIAIEPWEQNTLGWEWKTHVGPWETAPRFEADIATMTWTLENCGNPIGMLKYAARCATTVVVATGSRINVPFKKPLNEYLGKESPDLHAWRWSRLSLERAMFLAGLEVVDENDWQSRDEMILVARRGGSKAPVTENPKTIQKFFDEWERLWP